MRIGQVVDDDHIIPAKFIEPVDEVAADETGSSSHHNHDFSPLDLGPRQEPRGVFIAYPEL